MPFAPVNATDAEVPAGNSGVAPFPIIADVVPDPKSVVFFWLEDEETGGS